MPLLDIECRAGHRSEVLKRGAANNGPISCPECGGESKRLYSGFTFGVKETHHEASPKDPPKNRPKFIDRMGGGKAALDENKMYRPAVTHNTKCPKEGKWRNMAILNDLGFAVRVCCEGCGYTWLHQESTAANPLFKGVVSRYRPGKTVGSRYVEPERGA